jgi:hypothetical protein
MASMRPRTRKDGSTFWEVLFRHDGRQRSLSFETADHAGKFKELVGLVGPGKALAAYDLAPAPRAANGSGVTVAEWVEHHIEHLIGCEQKTIDEYRRFLKRDIAPGLGPIPLMSLTGEHLARWVQELKAKGNSGKTIRNKHGFVSSALNAAVKSGHIAVNPAAGQRLPRTERKEMVFLSKEEWPRIQQSPSAPSSESPTTSRARFRAHLWCSSTVRRPTVLPSSSSRLCATRSEPWPASNK